MQIGSLPDDQDSMHMVRHYDKGIQVHECEMCRYFKPAFMCYLPGIR